MRRAKLAAVIVASVLASGATAYAHGHRTASGAAGSLGGARGGDVPDGRFLRTRTLVPQPGPVQQPAPQRGRSHAAPPSRSRSAERPAARPHPRQAPHSRPFAHQRPYTHRGPALQHRPFVHHPRPFIHHSPLIVPAPVIVSPPVYYTPPPPVVYVERDDGYWYYCAPLGAYYPEVAQCTEPWLLVPPQ
jgi:hypothetical protein